MVDVGLAVFTPQSKLVVHCKINKTRSRYTGAFRLDNRRCHYFPQHTDYHSSTDVTEFGLLAVVVLELVGLVIDTEDRFWRFWFLLLHLHFLFIYKVYLEPTQYRVIRDV